MTDSCAKNQQIRIYKTVIRPILTYSVETRSDSIKSKPIFGATGMQILRKITNISRQNRIPNVEARQHFTFKKIEIGTTY